MLQNTAVIQHPVFSQSVVAFSTTVFGISLAEMVLHGEPLEQCKTTNKEVTNLSIKMDASGITYNSIDTFVKHFKDLRKANFRQLKDHNRSRNHNR